MKRTLKWYEPVGSDVILKEEEFIHSIDPTKDPYTVGRHALMLRLSLPLLLNIKEENKIYWNRCEVIKEEHDPEIVHGALEVLGLFGMGELFKFENDHISGLVFGIDKKQARRIIKHGLKERDLPAHWTADLIITEGNDWKYKPSGPLPINYVGNGYTWTMKILFDNRKISDDGKKPAEEPSIIPSINVHYT